MEKFLTLEMLLDLPEKVLTIANNSSNIYISMLDKKTCDEYYYSELRKNLMEFFKSFNEIKYSFSEAAIDINYTSNYNITENKKVANINSKVENYVSKKIKKEKFALDIYNRVCSLSKKLTFNEAIYFVNTFFAGTSEENISEELGISRTYLQRIKKSCLVKLYFEFIDLLKNNNQ